MSTPNLNHHSVITAKGFAILAVVTLHSLTLFPDTIYTTSPYSSFYIFLNQLTRFSVPLFLTLSGFGLARKYFSPTISKSRFLLKRFQKLLPLYLLWSFIIFFLLSATSWQLDSPNLLTNLLSGRTDYHLYFIPLIFQLYLVFTLLPHLSPRSHIFLTTATITLQFAWFYFTRTLALQPNQPLAKLLVNDQFQYRLIFNWLFYFLLGTLAAQLDLTHIRTKTHLKPLLIFLILLGLFWSTLDTTHLIHSTSNLVYATSFIRFPVFLYATAVSLFILIFGSNLTHLPKPATTSLYFFGQHSYFIYLTHTLGLRLIEEAIHGIPHPTTFTLAGASLLLGTIISHHLSPA